MESLRNRRFGRITNTLLSILTAAYLSCTEKPTTPSPPSQERGVVISSVSIGPNDYNLNPDRYPAVLFDISEKKILPAYLQSEDPPIFPADLWIEPGDPELLMNSPGRILLMGNVPLESITQAPTNSEFKFVGYNAYDHYHPDDPFRKTVDHIPESDEYFGAGSTFVFKTHEGRYGKLRITSLDTEGEGSISFDFLYQLDGSRNLSR